MLTQAKDALVNEQIELRDIMSLLDGIQNVTQRAFINQTLFPSDLMIAADIMIDISTYVGSMNNVVAADASSMESLLQVGLLTSARDELWFPFIHWCKEISLQGNFVPSCQALPKFKITGKFWETAKSAIRNVF